MSTTINSIPFGGLLLPSALHGMMEDINLFAAVSLGPGTLYGAITRLEDRGRTATLGRTTRFPRQPRIDWPRKVGARMTRHLIKWALNCYGEEFVATVEDMPSRHE